MKLSFVACSIEDIPIKENRVSGTVYYTNTGDHFIVKSDKELFKIRDVYTDFSDLADLEDNAPRVEGKIFVLQDGSAHVFKNGVFTQLIGKTSFGIAGSHIASWVDTVFEESQILLDLEHLVSTLPGAVAVVSTELTLKNESIDSGLLLDIYDGEILLSSENISHQGNKTYNFGISSRLRFYLRGRFSANFYVNYVKN